MPILRIRRGVKSGGTTRVTGGSRLIEALLAFNSGMAIAGLKVLDRVCRVGARIFGIPVFGVVVGWLLDTPCRVLWSTGVATCACDPDDLGTVVLPVLGVDVDIVNDGGTMVLFDVVVPVDSVVRVVNDLDTRVCGRGTVPAVTGRVVWAAGRSLVMARLFLDIRVLLDRGNGGTSLVWACLPLLLLGSGIPGTPVMTSRTLLAVLAAWGPLASFVILDVLVVDSCGPVVGGNDVGSGVHIGTGRLTVALLVADAAIGDLGLLLPCKEFTSRLIPDRREVRAPDGLVALGLNNLVLGTIGRLVEGGLLGSRVRNVRRVRCRLPMNSVLVLVVSFVLETDNLGSPAEAISLLGSLMTPLLSALCNVITSTEVSLSIDGNTTL